MKLGTLDISTVKLGTNQVQAVYQGSNLVWQNAPVATAATGVGQTSFTANWNAYTGAVVYLLDVSESSDFSTFVYEDQQVNAPSTSYVVIGLNPNTTYYYRVRASTEALTDADYQAVLDYATTQGYTLPSSGQQTLQNQLVVDLKDAGVWSYLDTFAIFATDGDEDFALIDWKRLTQYTAVNSPTITSNVGFQTNGSSSYINTNYNVNTQSTNFELLSNGLSYYMKLGGAIQHGARDSNNGNQMYYAATAKRHQISSKDYTTTDDFYFASVRNGTRVDQYLNNTNVQNYTNTPTALPNQEYYLLSLNNGGSPIIAGTGQISFFAMGGQFNNTDMYNAWNNYYTAL